jgi:hypothetical protein
MAAFLFPTGSPSPGTVPDPGNPEVRPYSARALIFATGDDGPSEFTVGIEVTGPFGLAAVDVGPGPLRDFLRAPKTNVQFGLNGLEVGTERLGDVDNDMEAATPNVRADVHPTNGTMVVIFTMPEPGSGHPGDGDIWWIWVRRPHSLDR